MAGIADQILRIIVPGGLQEPGGEVEDRLSEVKAAGISIASAASSSAGRSVAKKLIGQQSRGMTAHAATIIRQIAD